MRSMAAENRATDAVLKELRAFGLAYPGAHLKSPWPGHLDLAVKDKTFAYLSIEGEPFGISCKLPHSNAVALMLPFTEPTGYGLGKSGWISAKFPPAEKPPLELLKAWIDESYRAQAPKKLVATLQKAPSDSAEPGPKKRATPAPRPVSRARKSIARATSSTKKAARATKTRASPPAKRRRASKR
jgi:predicted DNA-binding protein (MmcQ/YjbR family)